LQVLETPLIDTSLSARREIDMQVEIDDCPARYKSVESLYIYSGLILHRLDSSNHRIGVFSCFTGMDSNSSRKT
jgi:hypothetical protein